MSRKGTNANLTLLSNLSLSVLDVSFEYPTTLVMVFSSL